MRTVNNKEQSLGLTFARTLPLRRTNLSQAIERLGNNNGEGISYKEIYETTDLGSIEAQATKRWLIGFGILDNELLTIFGKLILSNDPSLSELATQWICHYHFVSPHKNGPKFWRHAWEALKSSAEPISRDSIMRNIKDFYINDGGKPVSEDTYDIATRSFINAYTTQDGFKKINLFEENDSSQYQITTPSEIPWRAFAYMLADFWEANWGLTLSVPYADLSNDAGPGALLFLNSGQIGSLLRPMQEAGLIEVSRVARPWTVLRKWQSTDALLEAIYVNDDTTA